MPSSTLGSVNVYNARHTLIGNFTTVQAAVNFAGSVAGGGKTIVVDGSASDGTTNNPPFAEQVTVNANTAAVVGSLTNLTIQGINGAVLQAPSTSALVSTGQSPTNGNDLDSVLAIENTSGVTVTGLTVDGASQGANLASGQNTPSEVGIAVLNATGTTLDGVTVENVTETNLGANPGAAVYAANTTANAANTFKIDNSTISNFEKNGIQVLNAAASVTGNTVTGVVNGTVAQNGIEIRGSSGSVTGNTVSGIGYTRNDGTYNASGILALDGNNLSVASNKVTLSGLYSSGIFAIDYTTTQNDVSVTNNTVVGAGSTGSISTGNYNTGVYYQDGTGGGAVTGNTISNFDVGIEDDPGVAGTAAPTITGNTVGMIGSAYFLGDGTAPSPASFIANNTIDTTANGPGIITVSGANAPDGVFASIQAAVNAASSGDTINVGAGTYTEQVTVDGAKLSSLTIQGAGEGQTIIYSPSEANLVANVQDTTSARPDKFALVGAKNGANLTISGLTIDGHDQGTISDPNGYDFVGIDGLNSTIDAENVAVNNIQELDGTSPAGNQRDTAVVVDNTDGASRSFTMAGSSVSGFDKNGLTLLGTGLAVNVHGDTITGPGAITTTAQNGIELGNGATGSISNNTITGIDYTGPANATSTSILAFNAGSGVTLDGNSISSGAANGGDTGIYLYGTSGAEASGNTLTNQGTGIVEAGTFATQANLSGGNTYTGDTTNLGFFPDPTQTTGYNVTGTGGSDMLEGDAGNDTFTVKNAPNGSEFVGNGGIDTVKGYGAGVSVVFNQSDGIWEVTDTPSDPDGANAKTDYLFGIQKVTIAGQTYDLVDHAGTNTGGFQTIQSAVNAAASGDIILIAGNTTYNEQVTVDGSASNMPNNLTIQGMTGAVLQAPTTSLVSTATDAANGRDIDGVLTIENTSNVTVQGLTVDGADAGANLASGQNNPTEVGIAAINTTGTTIGGTGSANAITVENVRESNEGFGDQRGLGIYVENSVANEANTVTVQNSTVQNFQKNGITVKNAAATVINNTVVGTVNDVQAQNGIEVGGTSPIFGGTADGAVSGTVSGNTITNIGLTYDYGDEGDTASGILALNGNNLTITNNSVTLGNTTTLAVSGRTATAGAFADGIDAINYGEAQTNVSVTNNTITGAGSSGDANVPGRGIDYQAGTGGGAVTGNTIGGGFDIGLEIDPDNNGTNGAPLTGTAPPTITGNSFGTIGTDYFEGNAPGGAETFTNPTGSANYSIGSTTLTFNMTHASTYAGVIEDGTSGNLGGNLVVTGSAPLTLTGTNTYTGSTSVSGTLALAGTGSIASSTGVALTTSGATLDISEATSGEIVNGLSGGSGTMADLGGQNLDIEAPSGTTDTFSGVIADGGLSGGTGGSLELGGAGKLVLTAAETYTGATKLDAGTLTLTGAGSIATSSGLSLAANAAFDMSSEPATSIRTLSGAAGSRVDLGAGALTVTEGTASTFAGIIQDGGAFGGISGSLTVAGSAPLTLTGVNTYTGKTSVSGTLALSGSGSIQTSTKVALTTSGATLDISGENSGTVVQKLGGVGGTVTDLGSKNLKIKVKSGIVDSYAGTIADGGIAGGTGGSLELGGKGTLILTASDSYTGGTTIDAGTLELAAAGAGGTGTITFANPASNGVATLQIDAAALSGSNGFYDFADTIAGATSTNQVIDLTSLAYNPGSTTARVAGSTLLVGNGNSDVALHLAGASGKSSFVTASDGHGGTLVYDPPVSKPAPASIASKVSIDAHWIEMAMSDFGGVIGHMHHDKAAHEPAGLAGFGDLTNHFAAKHRFG